MSDVPVLFWRDKHSFAEITSMLTVRRAVWPADAAEARRILLAYEAGIDADLGLQGFAEELDGLPGRYGEPEGAFLLAFDGNGRACGCVGSRRLAREAKACEMKRFYVAPETRGSGLGRRLAEAVIERARGAGYREMKLDALPSFSAALRLYRELGFREVAPFGQGREPDLVYLGLDLTTRSPASPSPPAA